MNNKHQKKSGRPAHCLVVLFPTHSYIDPMIQFSKRLQDKGVFVTLVLTHSLFKSLHKSSTISFPIETISDGHDIGGLDQASSFQNYLTKFQQVGSQDLTQLLEKKKRKKKKQRFAVDCIVYAGILPWALEVAKKFGLIGAAFFGFSCAVNNIYYHAQKGLVKVPVNGSRWEVNVEGLPLLKTSDMGSLVYIFGFYSGLFDTHVNQFSNAGEADWLFCNTFHELEKQVAETMGKRLCQFRTIGPFIPSKYLDKRLENDKEYGVYRSKPGSRAFIKWLKNQPDDSVVYVSLKGVHSEQLTELAWGIKGSNKSFLWEVEESLQPMLPKRFVMECIEQKGVGMVVSWCSQVEALSQRSVGCFVTDCRWSSILEAKSLGVPIVAIPQWNDQRFNAKHVTDVWKTGVLAEISSPWFAGREVVEKRIKEVMEGERAAEMKRNAMEWMESAKNSAGKGGSSDRNIDEFVASLVHS